MSKESRDPEWKNRVSRENSAPGGVGKKKFHFFPACPTR
jgi:hypothetical protein